MNAIDLPLHTQIIGAALAAVILWFLGFFLIPAISQRWKLGRYVRRLRALPATNLEAISELFKKDRILSHLWEEFRDTLHEQKDPDSNGVYQVTAVRQT